jgi:hypothetical protein
LTAGSTRFENTTRNNGVKDMARLIKDKSTTKRLISAKEVAKALSAEDTGIEIDTRRGPVSLFSLQQFLVERLHSTGGRPKLEGARTIRNKIPLLDEDWRKLQELTKYYKEEKGIKVTSGQIASALIHAEVSKIDILKLKPKSHAPKTKLKSHAVSK